MPGYMIKNLSLIFGSKTKAQEIILLLTNTKEVVRQAFYESELPKVEKFCQEQKIYLVRSNFKVMFADESYYSNQGIRISEQDKRPGMHFIYFSKNEEKAWLAAYYELVNNHRDLGLVLGYPRCCVEYFCKNFNAKNTNLELPPTNIYTNLKKREQDLVLISHFPCNSNCEESIKLGRKFLDTIKQVDPQRAQELNKELKCQNFPSNL